MMLHTKLNTIFQTVQARYEHHLNIFSNPVKDRPVRCSTDVNLSCYAAMMQVCNFLIISCFFSPYGNFNTWHHKFQSGQAWATKVLTLNMNLFSMTLEDLKAIIKNADPAPPRGLRLDMYRVTGGRPACQGQMINICLVAGWIVTLGLSFQKEVNVREQKCLLRTTATPSVW